MDITINKKTLVDVLSRVHGICGRPSNLPSTKNVVIEADPETGTVNFMATDLETGYSGTFEAEINKGGKTAVHARKLFEIAKSLPGTSVYISNMENRWLKIGGMDADGEKMSAQFDVVGCDPDDVPEFASMNMNGSSQAPGVSVHSEDLEGMLVSTLAIRPESDDHRAHTAGVLVDFSRPRQRCLMVSTDGSRLVVAGREIYIEVGSWPEENKGFKVILSRKGLADLQKMIAGREGYIDLKVHENAFHATMKGESLIIRIMEGEYPNYQQMLDQAFLGGFCVGSEQLTDVIKRMSIMATQDYKAAVLKLEKEKLVITMTNPDLGESREEMAIDYDGPENAELRLNPKMLAELISASNGENITVSFTEKYDVSPMRIEPGASPVPEMAKDFVGLIMPMRV